MYNRIAVVAACAVAALALCTGTATGQVYPNKPIKIIVPFGPGGSTDITARVFGKFLEDQWKQPVVVENRAGANGIIGTEALKNSAPDGYTLALSSNSTHAAAPYLFKKLPYDPIKDFEHVGLFGVFGSVALVPAGSPFKSIPELASYARARPGKVFFGYFNTSSQIPGELLKAMADLPIESVPYKTITNAVPDLLSGQIQFMFMDYVAASSHIASGKLIPIAITEARRLERWPNVPAVAEFYPGYEVQAFLSLTAPAGTPKAIVARINLAMREAQANPAFKGQLENLGLRLRAMTPDEYQAFLLVELERWGQYIKAAKIEAQ
ncbi:MAG: tripartite tricarboxylate transporter substrate binding protein [Proteobacteria bacterium]|nr:tripartite tricarboxylate transporter substrate binding protein [Pseudomonadota bacterium]